MLFNVSKDPDNLLDEAFKFGEYTLYLDEGWHKTSNRFQVTFRKGYSLESIISEATPGEDGNFCVITYHYGSDTLTIEHDSCRGFPIFCYENGINNLYKGTELQTYESQKVWIHNGIVSSDYAPALYPTTAPREMEYEELLEIACAVLEYDYRCYLQNNEDFVLPPSDGIDTLTVMAVTHKDGVTSKLTPATTPRAKHMQTFFWGYNQLNDVNGMIGTGFCGDEFLMRNPLYANWFLGFHGIDLGKEYAKVPGTYMEGFIKHRYLSKLITAIYESEAVMMYNILNRVLNDHQMWHLDNTIAYTPFKNKFLAELMMSLKPEDAFFQATDGKLQRDIIRNFLPGITPQMSQHKNNVAP